MDWNKFWKLWFQKIFRNFASMKFQWLLLLYIPVIVGMFMKPAVISATAGLTFLGGGFITLATSRIVARTNLVAPKNEDDLDTDQ